MLRTALIRSSSSLVSSSRYSLLRAPTTGSATRPRAVHSSSPRLNSLAKPPLHEGQANGVEGRHTHDVKGTSNSAPTAPLQGDWVLFHPVYTEDELRAVQVAFRNARTWSDKIASVFVKVLRTGFDIASGYKHRPIPPNSKMSLEELRKGGYVMTESQWLQRILFLESVAGVPGMVAATLRHLRSLRLMRRDSGWIHTLLEEAENERMHLMTFMTLKNPGIMFRAMILGAQGVFYNLFFLSYLVSPKTCHRFVGHLEEEAVLTYTRCIEELEAGRLPQWSDLPAPSIAKDYWRLAPDAKLLDVMYAVRSDESTHRFVNHSLANLDQAKDVNPFVFREPGMEVKGVKLGFEREESEVYVRETRQMVMREKSPHQPSISTRAQGATNNTKESKA